MSSWTGHSKSPSVSGEHELVAISVKFSTPNPFVKTSSSLADDMPALINKNHCHTINIPNHEHERVGPWFGPQRFTQVLEVYDFGACAIRHTVLTCQPTNGGFLLCHVSTYRWWPHWKH